MPNHFDGKRTRLERQFAGQSYQFWALILFLAAIFVTGGASRADVKSLVILRPLAAALCIFGFVQLRSNDIKAFKAALGFIAACFVLVLIQIIPLPPSVWSALPGRQILVDVDAAAGVSVWRPIALVPSAAWNSLFALAVPCAVLLLGIRLTRDELFRVLPFVVSCALFSGVVGLGQSIGSPEGPLYFYKVTNNGAAVGLFANRNHQALLIALLFPMLAVFASTLDRREKSYAIKLLGCALAAASLVPLLLVTGSRTGLLLGFLGVVAAVSTMRSTSIRLHLDKGKRRINPTYLAAVVIGIGLLAVSMLTSRAEAVRRLLTMDEAEELRFAIWGPISEMAVKYFPVGSGAGSFAETYQIDEPSQLLRYSYVNHAHNDLLEVVLTMGLPGVLLVLIGVISIGRHGFSLRTAERGSRNRSFGYLGLTMLLMLGLGSLTDYPLRTPIMSALSVLAFLWLRQGAVRNKQASGVDAG